MSPITTHVLDLVSGGPAPGLGVRLEQRVGDGWQTVVERVTGGDGRIPDLLPEDFVVEAGLYRLVFDSGEYFARSDQRTFYPSIDVTFDVRDPDQHYHVPLLLGPFGYSTYRGT